MASEFISLLLISIGAFLCPVIASLIPNKIIPETVFLLIVGMILGPHVADIVVTGDAIDLLSDLGLAFLFLLAGYDIDPRKLSGKGGRSGMVTWLVTFAIAIVVVLLLPIQGDTPLKGLAIAIALTTTAYGTLVPILEERKLNNTPIGAGILEYGSWGELCPVIAIALLLTTRATWVTIMILIAFAVVAIITTVVFKRIGTNETRLGAFIKRNAETNSQMTMRAVLMLLIGLVTLSALFNLDIVLGSFVAGFILRAVFPAGNESLEHKLSGIGYGFFIPLFFIISGTKIDPMGVVREPVILVVFIGLLLLIRAVPIYVSLSLRKDTKGYDPRVKASIALYCTTALPLIVAVTTVAIGVGALSEEIGSVLVAAGGITVFLMPLLASVVMHTLDAEPMEAARAIKADPKSAMRILKEHRHIERERNAQRKQQSSKDRTLP